MLLSVINDRGKMASVWDAKLTHHKAVACSEKGSSSGVECQACHSLAEPELKAVNDNFRVRVFFTTTMRVVL